MKKSELKELLKVIVQEVVAAKQEKLNETKGLSGMKKAPESTDHTEKVADSKDLTGPAPKEKEEGKKLPVVKKPANPQKVGSIKEEILQMIREEIDEMARTAGAIGNKYKVQDPNSPTGWSIKGHKNVPDGTPTEAPKGGAPTVSTPTSTPSKPATDKAAVARTEDAVENILKFKPNATEQEVADELAKQSAEDAPLSLDATVISSAIAKAKEGTAGEEGSSEPDVAALAAKEKAEKQKKIANLRAYLMRKKGIKPA